MQRSQRQGDRLVGHARLAFDWRNGSATVARVAVAPAMRGRGLAVPLMRRIVDEAFEHSGIERVALNVYGFNVPAIRTYERLGFVALGVRISATLVCDERWDAIAMAISRSAHEVQAGARWTSR